MSVPEKFEGFFIDDSEHWTDFKRKEVRLGRSPSVPLQQLLLTQLSNSTSQSHLGLTMSTSRFTLAEFAVPTFTPSLEDGVLRTSHLSLDTKSSVPC
jgi:hypothetical protein